MLVWSVSVECSCQLDHLTSLCGDVRTTGLVRSVCVGVWVCVCVHVWREREREEEGGEGEGGREREDEESVHFPIGTPTLPCSLLVDGQPLSCPVYPCTCFLVWFT